LLIISTNSDSVNLIVFFIIDKYKLGVKVVHTKNVIIFVK